MLKRGFHNSWTKSEPSSPVPVASGGGKGHEHLDSTLDVTFRGRTSGGTPAMPEWLKVTRRCNAPA